MPLQSVLWKPGRPFIVDLLLDMSLLYESPWRQTYLGSVHPDRLVVSRSQETSSSFFGVEADSLICSLSASLPPQIPVLRVWAPSRYWPWFRALVVGGWVTAFLPLASFQESDGGGETPSLLNSCWNWSLWRVRQNRIWRTSQVEQRLSNTEDNDCYLPDGELLPLLRWWGLVFGPKLGSFKEDFDLASWGLSGQESFWNIIWPVIFHCSWGIWDT